MDFDLVHIGLLLMVYRPMTTTAREWRTRPYSSSVVQGEIR